MASRQSMSSEERSSIILEMMDGRDMTASELHAEVPVLHGSNRGYPNEETDVIYGETGFKVWSWQTTYQTLELLRHKGILDRRKEFGRSSAQKGHGVWVYFLVPSTQLQGEIAQLDQLIESQYPQKDDNND
ncbi:hypothetical protein EPO04_00330 [Patescibacteria group bacterium]|nr:MAG: hypothetical protein EPO04_00330 [Patescibacteria group bacterium]